MNWKYVKRLKSIDDIQSYETLAGYTFPEAFKECVRDNNGGRPDKKIFDTSKEKGRAIKTLLSFNKDDKETVWAAIEIVRKQGEENLIPFAVDNFGNLICFDSTNNSVVFAQHENDTVEFIASDFSSFLAGLH